MKSEASIFWYIAGFFLVVIPIYWFASNEIIGTTALILTLAFFAMMGTYLQIQSNKIDLRPEDRKDAEIAEGAGEQGFFPGRSIWPFWCAAAISVIALGPVFGWWLTIIGFAFGAWAVMGWSYEFYKGDYRH